MVRMVIVRESVTFDAVEASLERTLCLIVDWVWESHPQEWLEEIDAFRVKKCTVSCTKSLSEHKTVSVSNGRSRVANYCF